MDKTSQRRPLACLFAVTALVGSSFAFAADTSRVSMGEISVRACGADSRTEQMLRELVQREIDEMQPSDRAAKKKHNKKPERFVVDVSLVKLNASTSQEGARVSSVVSGTLRYASSGALVATTSGSSTVQDNSPALDKVKVKSLRTAVHGALKDVPDVI